ncbi:MAG: hypothetical protein CMN30_18580 [Sandaracinus sp.]|nr:hypothetical protein [Sandaracinus sp.]
MFTLDDLVAERAADPRSFASRWDVPVLVRGRDVAPQAAEIPLGFHTVTSDRAAIDAREGATVRLACYEFAFHGPEGLGELLDRRAFLRSSG